MNLEIIKFIPRLDNKGISFIIYRDLSTDLLWIKHKGIMTEVQISGEEKPCTYEIWKNILHNTVDASQEIDSVEINFEFEKVWYYEDSIFIREKSTDVMYIYTYTQDTDSTVMLDPETGLPLTYKVWEAKYKK